MSNLLAVDFDSFFPTHDLGDDEYHSDWGLYDWGHSETQFMIESIWPTRAAGFIQYNRPLPDLDGRQVDFWSRFKISRSAQLFYADSNACAVSRQLAGKYRRWESVWLYDAHHDSGYNGANWVDMVQRGIWTCEDWMVLYGAMGADLHMRYPEWRAWALDSEPKPSIPVERAVDNGSTPNVVFDRVFVCRSGAWVPPWNDIDVRFEEFVTAAPVKSRTDVQPGGMTRREFSMAQAEADAARWLQFKAANNAL
jgi:hypothetical protein